jgi:hypothetical protein
VDAKKSDQQVRGSTVLPGAVAGAGGGTGAGAWVVVDAFGGALGAGAVVMTFWPVGTALGAGGAATARDPSVATQERPATTALTDRSRNMGRA